MKPKKKIYQKLIYGSLIFSCIALSTVVYKQHAQLKELRFFQEPIENLSDKEEVKKKIDLIREISVNKAQKSIKLAREVPKVQKGRAYPNGSRSLEQFKATVFEGKEFSIDDQIVLDEDL